MADLYPFHQANIHEQRWAATICRLAPLVVFVSVVVASTVCLMFFHTAFLVMSAVLNVTMWVNIMTKGYYCLSGMCRVSTQLAFFEAERLRDCSDLPGAGSRSQPLVHATSPSASSSSSPRRLGRGEISHLIVIPNYKEDEGMLGTTLLSLSQAKMAHTFRVVLAMEVREGEEARLKGERLQKKYRHCFAQVLVALHPRDLVQVHLDGSVDPEVPGKASNLRWAVVNGFEQSQKLDGIDSADVICTVADADCLFHPNYFDYIGCDYDDMRKAPGSQHLWTMWQAPQLAYRNYYESPVCSRIWGVIASVYEFGGVSSLMGGGHHMTFSAYSLHLQLGLSAEAWDGDVIAEDHHCYIKCWFYSLYISATDLMAGRRLQRVCRPKLKIRPVFLPVKSLSVVGETYWGTWTDRFHQAKRHAQGVAELAYALLATWEALMSLPMRMHSASVLVGLARVNLHLWFTHLLPTLQAVVLAELSIVWIWNNRQLPMCPDRIWLVPRHETFLCGLAGGWAMMWPVVVPMILIWVANFLFLSRVFLKPGAPYSTSVWHGEDGGIPVSSRWSRHLQMALMLTFDCAVTSPLMTMYGLIPCLLSYGHLWKNGNRMKYITAAKGPAVKELELVKVSP